MTFKTSFLLLAVALGAGCPPKTPPPGPPVEVDPVTLFDRAAAEAPPGPVSATFDLRLRTPDQQVNAQGALVVSSPGRFRVEVRGPIGPPQLVLVSDGSGMTAWIAGKNQVYVAPDADERIRGYTGGAAGVDALAALLLGRLPVRERPDEVKPGPNPAYRWEGPAESRLDVSLDPRTGRVATLAMADEAGVSLVEAEVTAGDRPDRLLVRIPTRGVEAELRFGEWRPATPGDAAFLLPPPPGATVTPLDLGAPSGPVEAPAAPGG